MPRNAGRRVPASIAGCGVVTQASRAAQGEREGFAAEQSLPLRQPVCLITPDSYVPVARRAEATSLINDRMAIDSEPQRQVNRGFLRISSQDFAAIGPPVRIVLLTGYVTGSVERRRHSQLSKNCTANCYFATEIVRTRELGNQYSTELGRLPVCRHNEHR